MKNLKKAYLRISAETSGQFDAACQTPSVDLIYLDAGLFPAASWKELTAKAHKGVGGFGKLAVLRFPQIWRKKTELFFASADRELTEAGFDAFLVRNPEELFWLAERGVSEEHILCDHSIYRFNAITEEAFNEIAGFDVPRKTWSLELNYREIRDLAQELRQDPDKQNELVVYGRANLMVTAQCIRKTGIGCDRRSSLLWMKDRTGAMMPVRNCCTFCLNTIYNSVPTVLFDLKEEINEIRPDSVRYEFTTETQEEVKEILNGKVPAEFTRGHFKRGVL